MTHRPPTERNEAARAARGGTGRRVAQALLLLALGAAPLAAFGLDPATADASVAYASPYTYDQTLSTAVRMLRVDLGLKIIEKDADAGYLLFEYKSTESGARVSNGAMELVRGQEQVLVNVRIPTMPSYHESMVMDLLAKKLSAEYGEAPKRAEPKPKPVAPDAGPGEGDGDGHGDDDDSTKDD